MNKLKLKLNKKVDLIRRLDGELNSYKHGLMELMRHLDTRLEDIEKFKSTSSDLYKYIKCGEILEDITKNYTEHMIVSESIEGFNGEITDFIKVYIPKAEQQILDTEMFLLEIEEDDSIPESYVEQIKSELEYYKTKNIFSEFKTIQELLLKITNKGKEILDGVDTFTENLLEFNNLQELVKYNYLNDFCYKNIETNEFVWRLINLYNDYHAVEVISNIVEIDGMSLFSICNIEKLNPILDWSSEMYFKIVNTLNQLQQLNKDFFNKSYTKKQMELITKLQFDLANFIN